MILILRLEMMVMVHQEMDEVVNAQLKLTMCEISVLNQVSEHRIEVMESEMVALF